MEASKHFPMAKVNGDLDSLNRNCLYCRVVYQSQEEEAMKSNQFFTVIIIACTMVFAAPAQAHCGMKHHMMDGGCGKDLPPAEAKMIDDAMHQSMEKNKPLFERMRKLHERMRAIATADKFNKKAFLATADEMASIHMKMEKTRTRMMADVAGQLTAQERRDMAKCMEQNFHRGEFNREGCERDGDEHHGMRRDMPMDRHNSSRSYNQ
jgi:Spy/CpxP family protein refolding chaperone